MKVHSNFTGQKSKKRLIAFSCATALAGFALVAKPAFAEEVIADNASNLDVTTATTANVQTTADLVETKVVEAPPTTENVASTESTTNVSEQATTSATSSETASETALTTASESQAPAKSATGQTREAVTTDRAASETASVPNETNVTGGQYYSDDQGNWYYKDASGKNLTGDQTIDGVRVSFKKDGKQIKGPDLSGYGGRLRRYFDDNSGQLQTNRYLEYNGNWYYLDDNGRPLTGEQNINGQEVYFNDNGTQVKGDFSGREDMLTEHTVYYDLNSGARVRKEGIVQNKKGQIFYINADGSKYVGIHEIDGNLYYFRTWESAYEVIPGVLQRGVSVELEDGKNSPRPYGYGTPTNITRRYYFDPITGQAVKNRYVQENDGWYYYAEDGNAIRPQDGEVNIDGQIVYLYANGRQAKGELVLDNGVLRYYDPNSGARVSNTTLTVNGMTYRFDENGVGTDAPNPNGYYSDDNGNWYYKNANGDNLTGAQIINGQKVFFRENGQQVKGAYTNARNNLVHYFDPDSGELATNRYIEYNKSWYYVDKNGNTLKGAHTIDGHEVIFSRYEGTQVKGWFAHDGVYMPEYFYDKNNGYKVNYSGFVKNSFGDTYYHDETGRQVIGFKEIDGEFYYFTPGGASKYIRVASMEKNSLLYYTKDKIYYFGESGKAVKNRFVFTSGNWYYFNGDATAAIGVSEINGKKLYFNSRGEQIKGAFTPDGHYYDEISGELVTNQTRTIKGVTYHFDENGNATKV